MDTDCCWQTLAMRPAGSRWQNTGSGLPLECVFQGSDPGLCPMGRRRDPDGRREVSKALLLQEQHLEYEVLLSIHGRSQTHPIVVVIKEHGSWSRFLQILLLQLQASWE